MSDIIEGYKQEISELCDEVAKGIEDLNRAKGLQGVKRSDLVNKLKGRIGRAKQVLKSIKVELREMGKLEAKPHTEKASLLEEKIKQLEIDLDWTEKSDPNEAVVAQAQATDYKAVLAQGAAIQEDDIGRLKKVQQTIAQTTEVGTATLAKQQEQRDQIVRIDQGVDQVSSNIKLANKHLRVFVRRMATDKIIMGFLFLIFAGVIFIIVYSIIKPSAKTNVPQNWRANSS